MGKTRDNGNEVVRHPRNSDARIWDDWAVALQVWSDIRSITDMQFVPKRIHSKTVTQGTWNEGKYGMWRGLTQVVTLGGKGRNVSLKIEMHGYEVRLSGRTELNWYVDVCTLSCEHDTCIYRYESADTDDPYRPMYLSASLLRKVDHVMA